MSNCNFDIGHWRFKRNAVLLAADGSQIGEGTTAVRTTRTAVARLPAPSPGLGQRFVDAHPKYVKLCTGCSTSIRQRIDGWDVETVDQDQIFSVVRSINAKNPDYEPDEIEADILDFLEIEADS